MKSKLVLTACLVTSLLSGINVYSASTTMSKTDKIKSVLQWMDKVNLADTANLKVSIGPFGPTWIFESKAANGNLVLRCVSQGKVEQILPKEAVAWMLKDAPLNVDKTSTGIDLHRRIRQFKYKYAGQSFNQPKKDYSSLLRSLKTKVKPNIGILALDAAHQEASFYAKMANALHDKALAAPALHQIALEDAHGQAWTSFAQEATAASVKSVPSAAAAPIATPIEAATTATSKVAQLATHPTTQYTALAAGTLVAGTAIAGATVYGAQKAYNYMYPTQEAQPTRFERVKSAFNNGYNLALTNKGKTAGAVAAVAALGLVAYKYSDKIFGKSKGTSVSDVRPNQSRVTFKPAKNIS